MSATVSVPRLAESISEATLVEWLKPDGGAVRRDEPVATLETDKAAVEIAATDSGVLHHQKKAGDTVVVGDVLATIEPGVAPADGASAPAATAVKAPAPAPVAAAPASTPA
ncbi:MAG TPA: biotin/lipoyl-containing protein, partial [Candidatus Eisenbacteria bacterium]|nr:biotin/lipoyl-containing protein [Candidatus Eisenbacteria bacterium]